MQVLKQQRCFISRNNPMMGFPSYPVLAQWFSLGFGSSHLFNLAPFTFPVLLKVPMGWERWLILSYAILLDLGSSQPIFHYPILPCRRMLLSLSATTLLEVPSICCWWEFFTFWFLWSFQHSWSLSVLVSYCIIQACRKYAKKVCKVA